MRKRGVWVLLVVVAGVMALGTDVGAAKSATPRWVKHVQAFPGGISSGVRAYTDPGLQKAQSKARASSALSAPAAPATLGPLQNEQINEDSNPPLPQDETQVVRNPFDGNNAVAAANDYVNGGSQLYATTDGGQTWTTQYRSSRVKEVGTRLPFRTLFPSP